MTGRASSDRRRAGPLVLVVLALALATAPACGGASATGPGRAAVGATREPAGPARRTAPGLRSGGPLRFGPVRDERLGGTVARREVVVPVVRGLRSGALAGEGLAAVAGAHPSLDVGPGHLGPVEAATPPSRLPASGATAVRPAWTGPGPLTPAHPGGKG